MDKRYQVFVSSTYEDLREERQEVIQALLELDCIPSGMELFPASDDDQWTLIKKIIDDCDYYLVIVAGRYGSVGPSGKSYTQMEYEYAIAQGKPAIAFVYGNPGSIPVDKSEATEERKRKLDEFRVLVQKKMCKRWSSAKDLGSVVSRSIVKLIKSNPSTGWVRADVIPDESASREILRLRGQLEQLEERLAQSRRQAPKGTEELSQGDEIVSLSVQYDFTESGLAAWQGTNSVEVSWNEIFSVVSPLMIDKASEMQLTAALENHLKQRVNASIRVRHSGASVSSLNLLPTDFQKAKVQLLALGLIARCTRAVDSGNDPSLWTLTPWGEDVMAKLIAVRRNRVSGEQTREGG